MIKLAFGKNNMQQWADGLEGTLETGRSKPSISSRETLMQIRKGTLSQGTLFIYWKVYY